MVEYQRERHEWEFMFPFFSRYSYVNYFPGCVWNAVFYSHSQSKKIVIEFVIPIPNPKCWELNFAFPIQKVGNILAHFPFPIPNVQKFFPLMPAGGACTYPQFCQESTPPKVNRPSADKVFPIVNPRYILDNKALCQQLRVF